MARTDPPLPPDVLRRLVLRYGPHAPAAALGAHLRRAQGHSLEFREYRAYQPGDDIRTVDWRASYRRGADAGLLVRSFEAEKRMTLALVIDNRAEMTLPEAMPKLLYGLWALRAMAALALQDGDDVILARLFAEAGPPVLSLRGGAGPSRAAAWADAVLAEAGGFAPRFADLSVLERLLKPASAVVVISDMLFEDPERVFVNFVQAAQRRRRSVSILQLDSVGHELARLRALSQFRLVRGDGRAEDQPLRPDDTGFAEAEAAVAAHLRGMRQALAGPGLDWHANAVQWPAAVTDATGAPFDLRDLFAQGFPTLPLLAGLGLGRRA